MEDSNTKGKSIRGNIVSINVLSDECLEHVFSFLSHRERIGIERVCRRWRTVSLGFWRKIKTFDLLDFPFISFEEYKNALISQCNSYDEEDEDEDEDDEDSGYKTKMKVTQMREYSQALVRGFQRTQTNRLRGLLEKFGFYITSITIKHDMRRFGLDQSFCKLIAEHCPNLIELELSYPTSDKREIETLCNKIIPKLEKLTIDDRCQLYEEKDAIAYLKNAVNLEFLKILNASRKMSIQNFLSMSVQNVLSNLSSPKCKSLKLNNCKEIYFTSEIIDILKTLPLETLTIRGHAFPFESTSAPKIFENLRCLDISKSRTLTDSALSQLPAWCPHLKELNISDCDSITGKSIKSLASLRQLTVLKMDRLESVTSEVLRFFAGNQACRLQKIQCSQCSNLDDDGVIKMVTLCPELTSIDVCYCCKITEEFLRTSFDSVSSRTNNKSLTIGFNGLSQREVRKYTHPLLKIVSGPLNKCEKYFNLQESDDHYWDFDVEDNIKVKNIKRFYWRHNDIYWNAMIENDKF